MTQQELKDYVINLGLPPEFIENKGDSGLCLKVSPSMEITVDTHDTLLIIVEDYAPNSDDYRRHPIWVNISQIDEELPPVIKRNMPERYPAIEAIKQLMLDRGLPPESIITKDYGRLLDVTTVDSNYTLIIRSTCGDSPYVTCHLQHIASTETPPYTPYFMNKYPEVLEGFWHLFYTYVKPPYDTTRTQRPANKQ